MEWLLRVGDKEYKADSLETLRAWKAQGRVPPDSCVLHPTLSKWMYAKDIEELKSSTAIQGTTVPSRSSSSARSCLIAVVCVFALVALVLGVGFMIGSHVPSEKPEVPAQLVSLPPKGDGTIPFLVFIDSPFSSIAEVKREVFKDRPLGFRPYWVGYTHTDVREYLVKNGFRSYGQDWIHGRDCHVYYEGGTITDEDSYEGNAQFVIIVVPRVGWFRIR